MEPLKPLDPLKPVFYKIKENSWLARIAAKKLGTRRIAMVLGNTIHLWNTGKDEILKDEKWLRHELCHVRQFQRYGFIKFLLMYIWESIRKGYFNNKFEAEARRAENL